jgi:hypothetical protein
MPVHHESRRVAGAGFTPAQARWQLSNGVRGRRGLVGEPWVSPRLTVQAAAKGGLA